MSVSTEWGRIDDDGTVYVRTAEGERAVGSWQAGEPAAGLAHFSRRFEDLATELELLDKRLASGAGDPAPTLTQVRALAESLPTAPVVGDVEELARRCATVAAAAEDKLQQARERKAAAKKEATAKKEALVAEAETLAQSTQWKSAGDRLRAIVEEWRGIRGVDRRTDDALWKRFAAARDAFGKRRGAHFAELDKQREAARIAKQQIVTEAEGLAGSSDWGATGARMRQLLADWKATGRAPRDAEDALWTRFRTAQDAFFAARGAQFAERDAEETANQRAKEALIAEAEHLDPAELAKSQRALREIQDRFDAVGHVPRDAVRGLDARMRAAETRIRDAAEQKWDDSAAADNPLLVQLREAVVKASGQLDKARAADDHTRVAAAEAALQARREWLAEAEKSARR